MPEYHKFSRPRGSVHSVPYALSQKADGPYWLCVSGATLYVIQNLFGLDLKFKSRWAVDKTDDVYFPMTVDHADYEAWHDLIHQMQGEVEDMACDILTVLEEMRDEMIATNAKLDSLITATNDLVTAEEADDPLIDDLEEILDAVNVILGGTAILGA